MAEHAYITIQDMRDEGVPTSVTDPWLTSRILLASRMIENATKRWFYPRAQQLKVDGKGAPKVLLGVPIIHVTEITFETAPFYPSSLEIDFDLLRIYNRHLTQGLLDPDDRNNPKIELFHPSESLYQDGSYRARWGRLVFPEGVQNIIIDGEFGYTDPDPDEVVAPDGWPRGKTPELIKHACKLMVMRELAKLADTTARFDSRNRGRLTSERTRDQAYTLSPIAGAGNVGGTGWTGDPEIDGILALYARPPALGAA